MACVLSATGLTVILCAECALLWSGQRLLFGAMSTGRIPRPLIYLWAIPGTALHELAHLAACLLLGVPVGKVELFRPRRGPDGSVTLGQVEHAQCGPLRQALVSLAPLLFVPLLLLGLALLLLGGDALSRPWESFLAAPLWVKGVLVYAVASAGGAAFPSPGDHIPLLGAFGLVLLLLGLMALLGAQGTIELGRTLALLLAPASIAAALQLAFFSRRPRGQ